MQKQITDSETPTDQVDNRSLYGLGAIMLTAVLLGVLIPAIKGMMMFLPVIYILFEKRRMKYSWAEFGVKRAGYIDGVKNNWHLIILVVFVIQTILILASALFLPSYMEHIFGRILWSPGSEIAVLIGLLLNILMITFIEELVDRGLIQTRFSDHFGTLTGIAVGSLFMTAMHWFPGDPLIVFIDLATIFVGSSIYGLIYHRSRSVLVAWTAHLSVDIFDIALMLLLF